VIRDGKEQRQGKWERCQEKIREAGGGGTHKEGVQVCMCRHVQMPAGRGPGEGERLGHVCRNKLPAKGSRVGPVSEATKEHVCLRQHEADSREICEGSIVDSEGYRSGHGRDGVACHICL